MTPRECVHTYTLNVKVNKKILEKGLLIAELCGDEGEEGLEK